MNAAQAKLILSAVRDELEVLSRCADERGLLDVVLYQTATTRLHGALLFSDDLIALAEHPYTQATPAVVPHLAHAFAAAMVDLSQAVSAAAAMVRPAGAGAGGAESDEFASSVLVTGTA